MLFFIIDIFGYTDVLIQLQGIGRDIRSIARQSLTYKGIAEGKNQVWIDRSVAGIFSGQSRPTVPPTFSEEKRARVDAAEAEYRKAQENAKSYTETNKGILTAKDRGLALGTYRSLYPSGDKIDLQSDLNNIRIITLTRSRLDKEAEEKRRAWESSQQDTLPEMFAAITESLQAVGPLALDYQKKAFKKLRESPAKNYVWVIYQGLGQKLQQDFAEYNRSLQERKRQPCKNQNPPQRPSFPTRVSLPTAPMSTEERLEARAHEILRKASAKLDAEMLKDLSTQLPQGLNIENEINKKLSEDPLIFNFSDDEWKRTERQKYRSAVIRAYLDCKNRIRDLRDRLIKFVQERRKFLDYIKSLRDEMLHVLYSDPSFTQLAGEYRKLMDEERNDEGRKIEGFIYKIEVLLKGSFDEKAKKIQKQMDEAQSFLEAGDDFERECQQSRTIQTLITSSSQVIQEKLALLPKLPNPIETSQLESYIRARKDLLDHIKEINRKVEAILSSYPICLNKKGINALQQAMEGPISCIDEAESKVLEEISQAEDQLLRMPKTTDVD